MKEDWIDIEILADGTVKTSTDEVGQVNHKSADEFLEFVARLLGGQTATTKRRQSQSQTSIKLKQER